MAMGLKRLLSLGNRGAFSCRNILWRFQVWKPTPGSFSFYDIPSGVYRIAAQFRVGNGHLQSGLGKSWDNTERKSDRLLQKGFEESEVFLKGFLTPGLGNWDTEELWALEIIILSTIRWTPHNITTHWFGYLRLIFHSVQSPWCALGAVRTCVDTRSARKKLSLYKVVLWKPKWLHAHCHFLRMNFPIAQDICYTGLPGR